MDILRAILDGVAIAAIFNGAVASLALINPRWFLDSYPSAIGLVGICFVYSVASLMHSPIIGFWNLFWMSYIQWSILNAGDFLLLDCLLFLGKYKSKIVIPGTEGHKDYEFKNWMKHLAIWEHFLFVPFLLIPIISVIQAFIIGVLVR